MPASSLCYRENIGKGEVCRERAMRATTSPHMEERSAGIYSVLQMHSIIHVSHRQRRVEHGLQATRGAWESRTQQHTQKGSYTTKKH